MRIGNYSGPGAASPAVQPRLLQSLSPIRNTLVLLVVRSDSSIPHLSEPSPPIAVSNRSAAHVETSLIDLSILVLVVVPLLLDPVGVLAHSLLGPRSRILLAAASASSGEGSSPSERNSLVCLSHASEFLVPLDHVLEARVFHGYVHCLKNWVGFLW